MNFNHVTFGNPVLNDLNEANHSGEVVEIEIKRLVHDGQT
jgi:hypothetical protein